MPDDATEVGSVEGSNGGEKHVVEEEVASKGGDMCGFVLS